MRPFAKDNIKQDQTDLGIGCFLPQSAQPQIVVHHGMQPPLGKFIFAQVQDGVRLADQVVFEFLFRAQRDIAVDGVRNVCKPSNAS